MRMMLSLWLGLFRYVDFFCFFVLFHLCYVIFYYLYFYCISWKWIIMYCIMLCCIALYCKERERKGNTETELICGCIRELM